MKYGSVVATLFSVAALVFVVRGQADDAAVMALIAIAWAVLSLHEKG